MQLEGSSPALVIARQLAGSYPLADSYHRGDLAAAMSELAPTASRLVEEHTGLAAPDDPMVLVIDRIEWVERNLAFFSELLKPLEAPLGEAVGDEPAGGVVSQRLLGFETGAVLGLISRRVLGQYELLLPSDEGPDHICLPAPNILEMERRFQLHPGDFRFWVMLHEVTHRLQFTAVPWLRDHFLNLARQLAGSARPADPARFRLAAKRLYRALEQRRPPLGEAGLPGLMATREELALLDEVQALMSLVEGHGHVVMDQIARQRLATWPRMAALFTNRRQTGRMAALLRLSGLEMKLRQYEDGRRFVEEVEEEGGPGTINLVWESPRTLPTRAEIENPAAWLARVA